MKRKGLWLTVLAEIITWTVAPTAGLVAQEATTPMPPPRVIPGITAEDAFPEACVDCHRNFPTEGMDVRLSTAIARWGEAADPALVSRAQGLMPEGIRLTGFHPLITDALSDIPSACLSCHRDSPTEAPPLPSLLHLIHLTRGSDNHFLSVFQGECTHCHKLDQSTGAWRVPSRAER